jgi:hypothetical protein
LSLGAFFLLFASRMPWSTWRQGRFREPNAMATNHAQIRL